MIHAVLFSHKDHTDHKKGGNTASSFVFFGFSVVEQISSGVF
jgi:hypothetical protein